MNHHPDAPAIYSACQRAGVVLFKTINTPANLGKSPELALACQLENDMSDKRNGFHVADIGRLDLGNRPNTGRLAPDGGPHGYAAGGFIGDRPQAQPKQSPPLRPSYHTERGLQKLDRLTMRAVHDTVTEAATAALRYRNPDPMTLADAVCNGLERRLGIFPNIPNVAHKPHDDTISGFGATDAADVVNAGLVKRVVELEANLARADRVVAETKRDLAAMTRTAQEANRRNEHVLELNQRILDEAQAVEVRNRAMVDIVTKSDRTIKTLTERGGKANKRANLAEAKSVELAELLMLVLATVPGSGVKSGLGGVWFVDGVQLDVDAEGRVVERTERVGDISITEIFATPGDRPRADADREAEVFRKPFTREYYYKDGTRAPEPVFPPGVRKPYTPGEAYHAKDGSRAGGQVVREDHQRERAVLGQRTPAEPKPYTPGTRRVPRYDWPTERGV